MTLSAVAGWSALLLLPMTALAGWLLRRKARGSFIARMRPHFILGYAAVALALVHLALSMGAMRGTNVDGIWLATLAFFGFGVQAFIGTNLQSPGAYRLTLRRWHVLLFWTILGLSLGHILLNAPFAPSSAQSGARILTISASDQR